MYKIVDTRTTDYLIINLLFSEEYYLIFRRFTCIKKMIYKVKEKRNGNCIITQNLSFLLNNLSCSLSISSFLLLYFGVWVFDLLVKPEEGSEG
jgi:hypothetical protein